MEHALQLCWGGLVEMTQDQQCVVGCVVFSLGEALKVRNRAHRGRLGCSANSGQAIS